MIITMITAAVTIRDMARDLLPFRLSKPVTRKLFRNARRRYFKV